MRNLAIINFGHGFDTQGKRTPLFPDGSFMHENEFNRATGLKLYNLLEPYKEIDVYFTNTEKYDIGLDEMVKRANEYYNANKHLYDKVVLISIHANAIKDYWNNIGQGTATFYYPSNMTDKAFAEVIQKNLINKTKLIAHRGGVVPGDFQILREVKMTAALVECAFMDNIEEAKMLTSDSFRQTCAEGIINGLKEYFGMNEQTIKVDYSVTQKGTYQLKGDVKDFGMKIVDKSNRSIQEKYCVNGTFFWHDAKGVTYSTSILFKDGKTYKEQANHLPYPQSVFIVDKNNNVAMKRIKNLTELDLNNLRLVIGGIGLRNTLDANFIYNPGAEGFIGAYADVLRNTSKTVIGYNKKENKIYLMCRENIPHRAVGYDLLELAKDCEYDIALSVDGGGSTFMNNETDMVLKGDGRRINNILGFGI